jgi:hypothetical protein
MCASFVHIRAVEMAGRERVRSQLEQLVRLEELHRGKRQVAVGSVAKEIGASAAWVCRVLGRSRQVSIHLHLAELIEATLDEALLRQQRWAEHERQIWRRGKNDAVSGNHQKAVPSPR